LTITLCKRLLSIAFFLSLVQIAGLLSAQSASNPAVVPADRMHEKWWADRHNAILEQIHSHPDTNLVLIGDSITSNYDKANPPDENFQPTWNQFYALRKTLNLGFSGDTTANVMWRLHHGELDGIHPEVAIVLIGTNNTGTDKLRNRQRSASTRW